MTTVVSASVGATQTGDREVPLWRLHLLRAFAVLGVVGLFSALPSLIQHEPTDRGMIKAILGGLWVMALFGLRYPLQMLPIFLFELVWKTIWLLAFGLPQWWSGVGSPRLSQDLWEIGAFPFVIGLVIPWGYVWRHYFRKPGDRWR